MSSTQLILDYYRVQNQSKRLWWRRTLIAAAKLVAEFMWLAIVALAAIWLGTTLAASH